MLIINLYVFIYEFLTDGFFNAFILSLNFLSYFLLFFLYSPFSCLKVILKWLIRQSPKYNQILAL